MLLASINVNKDEQVHKSATGDRLKEGSAINQSLSILGNCIKALADSAEGKRTVVPFRDSKPELEKAYFLGVQL